MFLLERMRSALARGCPDPVLPRAVEAMDTLATIAADPMVLATGATVDAYLAALGDAMRYVYVDMVAPFIPTTAQLSAIQAPSTNGPPSRTLFVYGMCCNTLRIVSDTPHRTTDESPAERLFRTIAKNSTTPERRAITLGLFCLAAFLDDEVHHDILEAAVTVGMEMDPTHPLFYLTRAGTVPSSERVHWTRRGLDACAGTSTFYTVFFSACIDREAADMALYRRCVRPWVAPFVDRAVLRPLFKRTSVDLPMYWLVYTCDVCGVFALHLRRGACSRACVRARRKKKRTQATTGPETIGPDEWQGPFAALKVAVDSHACGSCGGRRRACYCAAATVAALPSHLHEEE
jgi:hypothetical protein